MTLHRRDLDQAARYLRYACELLLERQAFGRTVTLREVLEMAARRLSAGDHYVGDAAAEMLAVRKREKAIRVDRKSLHSVYSGHLWLMESTLQNSDKSVRI
jgi:hypothetical protein